MEISPEISVSYSEPLSWPEHGSSGVEGLLKRRQGAAQRCNDGSNSSLEFLS
jgi:hypothetical protein